MKLNLCMSGLMKDEIFGACIRHFKDLPFSAEAADLMGTCSLRSKKLSAVFQILSGAESLTNHQLKGAN